MAIELALRALGVSAGAEVVLPTFCCTSVMPPIVAVGAIPVLADVGNALHLTPETVEAALSSRTQAVLVPHLFGNPAPINAIVDLCRARGIVVIDDAAQALGARLNDQALGTFGDAGLVSFGNGKICFGTGGGVLISRRHDLLERAELISLTRSAALDGLCHALSILVWRKWRRWSLPLYGLWSRWQLEEKRPVYSAEAMSNLDAAVALTLIETLEENLRARRERVSLYRTLLASIPHVTLLPHHPGSACLLQVLHIESYDTRWATAQMVINSLRARGIEASESYTPLHLLPEYRQYARGPLHNAERLWSTLVELPCEPTVSLDDIGRIAATVRETLQR